MTTLMTLSEHSFMVLAIAGSAIALSLSLFAALLRQEKKRQREHRQLALSDALNQAVSGNALALQEAIDLDRNALRSMRDSNGQNALHLAAANGHLNCVQMLLDNAVDGWDDGAMLLAENDHHRWMPVFEAVYNGHTRCAMLILGAMLDGGERAMEPTRQHVDTLRDANGWTLAAVALASGHVELCRRLVVERHSDVNAANERGHTLAIIAAANGLDNAVQWLLADDRVDWRRRTAGKLESPLFMAARNRNDAVVQMMLESGRDVGIAMATSAGTTVLHAAVTSENVPLVERLLGDADVDVGATRRDGTTALHCAVHIGHIRLVRLLLAHDGGGGGESKCGTIACRDRFGVTPLLLAASRGFVSIVEALLGAGASLGDADDDGLTALHHVAANNPSASTPPSADAEPSSLSSVDHVATARLLIERGANVNAADRGHATALHVVATRKLADAPALASLLLDSGADIFVESQCGWVPLRNACDERIGNERVAAVLRAHAERVAPDWLATFDPTRPRKCYSCRSSSSSSPTRAVVAAASASTEVSKAADPEQLRTLVDDIERGRYKRIVIMAGAGISVSSGIPAWRTPSGLLSVSTPASVRTLFSAEAFAERPVEFYAHMRSTFAGKQPSVAHRFVAALARRGLLQRIFTQNIDGLELDAGVDVELVVQAHGSLHEPKRCAKCHRDSDAARFRRAALAADPDAPLPECDHCASPLRPAVVFFGEPLPNRFTEHALEDLRAADLLIVMGTSLKVYPFAALANDVRPSVPRLLLNAELVGPFTRDKATDFALLGDIDEIVHGRFSKLVETS
jgi:NAD-dependent SIR2 family protein deacetylase/ankyrin repeat protein